MWRFLPILLAVGITAGEIDILRSGKGLETLSCGLLPHMDAKFADEFIPFSEMVQPGDDGVYVVRIPTGRLPEWSTFPFTHVGPFPVTPGRRYRLTFQGSLTRGTFNMLASAFYLNGGRFVGTEGLLGTSIRRGGMPAVSQEFVVPPEAEELLLWWAVSDTEPIQPGPKAVVKALMLTEVGGVPGNPAAAEYVGRELLPVADLAPYESGPFAPPKNTFQTQNNTVEVVAAADGKCLHIVRGEDGRPYPHFLSVEAPFYGMAAEFSFRIRGRGIVQPGVWWKRPVLGWHYGHRLRYALTDEWQTLSMTRVCLDPGTRQAGCSFSIASDTADFEVRDIHFRLLPAGGRTP